MGDITYKCPTCGAPLVFKGDTQGMTCDWCGSSFTLDQLKANASALSADAKEDESWKNYDAGGELDVSGMKGYTCPQCGAEIEADATAAAMECPFCGYPAIIGKQLTGNYKPDAIIPFAVTKDQAKKALADYYKGRKLLPDSFTRNNRIDKISGIYVPYWMFDCEADARIAFDARKTTEWSDDKNSYTKEEEYRAYRSGSLSFEKIPVSGNSKIDAALMESIEPYDYKNLKSFENQYLAGYMANKYDLDADKCAARADERVKASTEEALKETVTGYDSVSVAENDTSVRSGKVSYTMMPIWLLNTVFENKNYTFAMNGQSGKMTGDLPVDKGKFFKWLFGIFAVIAAVLCGIVVAVKASRGTLSSGLALPVIVILIVAFLIALIAVSIMKSNMRPVGKQLYASDYIKKDSLRITNSRDVLTRSNTTKTAKSGT